MCICDFVYGKNDDAGGGRFTSCVLRQQNSFYAIILFLFFYTNFKLHSICLNSIAIEFMLMLSSSSTFLYVYDTKCECASFDDDEI